MKIPTQYIFTWQLILSSSSLNTQFAQLSHELSILPLYFNLFTQLLQACNYEDREHRDITMLTLPAVTCTSHISLAQGHYLGLYLIKTDHSP